MSGHINSFRCFYVHNCLMDMFSGIMTWFNISYFTEFKAKILGGYDRAIKEIQDFNKTGAQPETIKLPAISINPFGDIATDPKFPQLWRLKDIGENLQDLYMDPLYEDEYFGFSVIANRFTGNFEVIIYVETPYEYLDHYIQSIMFFHGGYNRRVRPGMIRTHAIIPDEVLTTAYSGAPYDWTNSGIAQEFVKVLNRDHYLFPMEIGPQIWLNSITNASTVYGEDGLSTYKIQMVVEYDVDIPTHMIVRNYDRIHSMNIKIATRDPVFIPETPKLKGDEATIVLDWDNMKGIPEGILGPSPYFKKLKIQEYYPYIFAPDRMVRTCSNKETIKHKLTVQYVFDRDVTATEGFQIDISAANHPIDVYDKIIIGDRIGMLVYGTAYEVDLELTGTIITVKMEVPSGRIWDILLYTVDTETI